MQGIVLIFQFFQSSTNNFLYNFLTIDYFRYNLSDYNILSVFYPMYGIIMPPYVNRTSMVHKLVNNVAKVKTAEKNHS